MDYSNTINLPKTDFPMRANLPQREPEIMKKWEKENIYHEILDSRKGKDTYILHDGPPYANGHIHIGHALNKILKDIIIKHKTMMGFRSPYVPGWDCHGLPIELKVTKELGEKAKSMPKNDIRKKCREYADKFIKIQMEEFKRLGVFGNYEKPYKTMTNDYEADIIKVFGELFKQGYIFKGKKPIYWCPSCETALAEAEVEYENHTSTSVYVKFKAEPESVSGINGIDREKTHVIIWTTTPWTLPANLGLSFHPDFAYSAFKFGDEFYIMADGLAEKFGGMIKKQPSVKIGLTKETLAKIKAFHPFIKRESKIIFGNHVTLDQGTGIVHTAPGHGLEDYIIGIEYGLDVFCPVDHQGRYTDEYKEMKGILVWDANKQIVEKLKDMDKLIFAEDFDHSYPHCWRCKKPLIFRATDQWFLGIDKNNLRDNGMKAVNDTQWIPSWGESRFKSMVETRPDWCLSRQRSWGVPIPSITCKDCGENATTAETILFFSDKARKDSIDSWYSKDVNELIPAGTKCKCGSTNFEKEYDILDVWFDSGVSSFAVLDHWEELRWPADMYLEGSDQHRGWFQSSLWPALALRGRAPFNTVLTHGFVLDEQGKAMSKSMGNVVPPETIIKQFGADVLRMWVSSEDYRNDVRIGMDMIKQTSDSYRKIRNTFKFIIGNLSDFDDKKDMVPYEKLTDLDKWVLHNLSRLNKQVIESYEKFEFHLVYRRILNFCAVELSSLYFDVSKDILYTDAVDSLKRRSSQTVLSELLKTLQGLIAPILSFTAEEIWVFNKNSGSVHASEYHKLNPAYDNENIEKKIGTLIEIKKDILKALELKRKENAVSRSQEADVFILPKNAEAGKLIEEIGDDANIFFQVAKSVIVKEKDPSFADYDSAAIKVEKTGGKKCVRCWNYYDSLGSDAGHPELCERCTNAIKQK